MEERHGVSALVNKRAEDCRMIAEQNSSLANLGQFPLILDAAIPYLLRMEPKVKRISPI